MNINLTNKYKERVDRELKCKKSIKELLDLIQLDSITPSTKHFLVKGTSKKKPIRNSTVTELHEDKYIILSGALLYIEQEDPEWLRCVLVETFKLCKQEITAEIELHNYHIITISFSKIINKSFWDKIKGVFNKDEKRV